MKTPYAFEWSAHAVQRLGERFGTRSPRIRNLIETMIATEEYTAQPDPEGKEGVFLATLKIRENPVTLVLAHHHKRNKTIVVTVRPSSKPNVSRKRWFKH